MTISRYASPSGAASPEGRQPNKGAARMLTGLPTLRCVGAHVCARGYVNTTDAAGRLGAAWSGARLFDRRTPSPSLTSCSVRGGMLKCNVAQRAGGARLAIPHSLSAVRTGHNAVAARSRTNVWSR